VIYVYAIGEREGELVPFVREDVQRAPAPDEEALREHDRVVTALMEDGPVLPMRFGTVAGSEADVRELLARRGEELRGQLAHVRGRVEMGVRAMWDDEPAEGGPVGGHAAGSRPAPSRPANGAEFMRRKAKLRAAARQRATALDEAIADLSVDKVVHLIPRDDTAFSASYLVEHHDAEAFAARAGEHATVTGPWPPYSFSG
jgi:hypothetical protein